MHRNEYPMRFEEEHSRYLDSLDRARKVIGPGGIRAALGIREERRMRSFAIHEIVRSLTGKIAPAGKTEVDEQRLENLNDMIEAVDFLVDDIIEVALLADRPEHSISSAGKRAADYLRGLRNTIEGDLP